MARLRTEAGISQAKAGELFGVSGQNWAKYENGRAPSIEQKSVQQRLAKAVGSDLEGLMLAKARLTGDAPPQRPGFGVAERGLWVASRSTDAPSLPITERVQAGAWLFNGDGPDVVGRAFPLGRDPRFAHADQWLAEVVDDAAEGLSIFDGDLVHCVAADQIGYYPKTGDIVLVERRRVDGQERERTLRQVEIFDGGVRLWMRTENKRHKGSELLGTAETGPVIRALIVAQVRRF